MCRRALNLTPAAFKGHERIVALRQWSSSRCMGCRGPVSASFVLRAGKGSGIEIHVNVSFLMHCLGGARRKALRPQT